jgi:hypothetical protein
VNKNDYNLEKSAEEYAAEGKEDHSISDPEKEASKILTIDENDPSLWSSKIKNVPTEASLSPMAA